MVSEDYSFGRSLFGEKIVTVKLRTVEGLRENKIIDGSKLNFWCI